MALKMNWRYFVFSETLQKSKQRVVLNGQTLECWEIIPGVPQGSVLGPLIFLIYINDLPDGIISLWKIFADDTSLFSKVHNINKSVNEVNADLEKMSQWTYQWKMQFNPDHNKQANEVIFSCISDTANVFHLPIKFNNNSIAKCCSQKHLGIALDSKLNFNSDVVEKIKKYNKLIGLIRRLSVNLPWNSLLTIFKSFIRPHLDYGDILYDKPNNENFQNKIEEVQYRACLTITDVIQEHQKKNLCVRFTLTN